MTNPGCHTPILLAVPPGHTLPAPVAPSACPVVKPTLTPSDRAGLAFLLIGVLSGVALGPLADLTVSALSALAIWGVFKCA